MTRPVAPDFKNFTTEENRRRVCCEPATAVAGSHDVYVTDPPYGDAVKYEEILEFFIAWLRKNSPPEFADWVWDSRRTLAIKARTRIFAAGWSQPTSV